QRYAADQSVVLPLDPGHIGQEHQLFSLESSGNFAGNQVGVDVIAFPVHADPDRGDDRQELALLQGLDQLLVHLDYIADETDVHHLHAAVVVPDLLQHLFTEEEIAVLAGKPDCPAAMLVQVADHLLVDLAGQHHLDHCHGLFVCDPHPPDELGDDAVALQGLVDLRTAAMDHDHVDAERAEQDHIEGKRFLQRFICHGVPAVLDDDGLAGESPDVRERLHQRVRLVDILLHEIPQILKSDRKVHDYSKKMQIINAGEGFGTAFGKKKRTLPFRQSAFFIFGRGYLMVIESAVTSPLSIDMAPPSSRFSRVTAPAWTLKLPLIVVVPAATPKLLSYPPLIVNAAGTVMTMSSVYRAVLTRKMLPLPAAFIACCSRLK